MYVQVSLGYMIIIFIGVLQLYTATCKSKNYLRISILFEHVQQTKHTTFKCTQTTIFGNIAPQRWDEACCRPQQSPSNGSQRLCFQLCPQSWMGDIFPPDNECTDWKLRYCGPLETGIHANNCEHKTLGAQNSHICSLLHLKSASYFKNINGSCSLVSFNHLNWNMCWRTFDRDCQPA